jgi:hypothetical protein
MRLLTTNRSKVRRSKKKQAKVKRSKVKQAKMKRSKVKRSKVKRYVRGGSPKYSHRRRAVREPGDEVDYITGKTNAVFRGIAGTPNIIANAVIDGLGSNTPAAGVERTHHNVERPQHSVSSYPSSIPPSLRSKEGEYNRNRRELIPTEIDTEVVGDIEELEKEFARIRREGDSFNQFIGSELASLKEKALKAGMTEQMIENLSERTDLERGRHRNYLVDTTPGDWVSPMAPQKIVPQASPQASPQDPGEAPPPALTEIRNTKIKYPKMDVGAFLEPYYEYLTDEEKELL